MQVICLLNLENKTEEMLIPIKTWGFHNWCHCGLLQNVYSISFDLHHWNLTQICTSQMKLIHVNIQLSLNWYGNFYTMHLKGACKCLINRNKHKWTKQLPPALIEAYLITTFKRFAFFLWVLVFSKVYFNHNSFMSFSLSLFFNWCAISRVQESLSLSLLFLQGLLLLTMVYVY